LWLGEWNALPVSFRDTFSLPTKIPQKIVVEVGHLEIGDAVHVKDIAPAGEKADEDGWADVGTGTLDWKHYIADVKAKTQAKYFVLEHDKPSDAIRFARTSMATLKGYGV